MTMTKEPKRKTTAARLALHGILDDVEARKKVQRAALRLALTDVHLEADESGAATLRFVHAGCRVVRTHARFALGHQNLMALALWLENRVRAVERGVDSVEEAFGPDLVAPVGELAPRPAWATGYGGDKSVEDCIAMFRSAIRRLAIPERDVKVTWDTQAQWSRLRLRLPSGAIVDKRIAAEGLRGDVVPSLVLLALWLQARTLGWEEHWEGASLDDVFAGNLLAPALAPTPPPAPSGEGA